MNERLRKTGLEMIGDVAWGTHFCQFYQTAHDLLDILVPYFAEGLRNNEFCMWITSEPLGVEAARAAMAAAVPGFEDPLRRGQIEIIPHTEWYLRGGTFDAGRVLDGWVKKLEEARAAGFEGLRLSGNTFWLEPGLWSAFTDYEAAVDGVIARYRMLALCTYSLDRCGFREILDVIGNHRFALVRREGGWEAVENAERLRHEEALQQSRESFRVTLNSIGDAVIATDAGSLITFLNPVASALTGWPPEEALGRPVREVCRTVNEATREPAEDVFARVISEKRSVAMANNTALVARDGRLVSIEDSAAPILDPAGGLIGAVLVFHDVTGKRQAQRDLSASEEKYRLLFQNMGEGFALYELVDDEEGRPVDWRVLEVNDAYQRHTGIPPERIVGRRVGELFPASLQTYLPIFARVVATQTPETFETYAQAVGRYQRIFTFPAGGRRFANTIEDISERKRAEEATRLSEERFRGLFRNMTEGFAVHQIVTDDAGKPIDFVFLDINPAFERLTGLAGADVVGRRVTEVLPGIEPYWIETYGRVALTGEAVTFERFYPAPLDRWYEVIAYRPEAGHFATIFMDITDRKRIDEELRQRQLDLDRSQEVGQIGWWRLDTLRNVLTWSDETHRIFGIPKGTPLDYETFLGAIPPGDREYVDGKWLAALRGEPYDIEHRVLADGRVKWVREKAYLEFDGSGGMQGGFGIVQDITDRKNTESLRQALAEQDRLRLGAAVEQASDSVVMVDLDGTIRYVNAAFETINRLARTEAVGGSYFDFFREEGEEARTVREAVGRGLAWSGRQTRAMPTGRPAELEITISPAKEPSGAVIGGLITEKDITRESALQEQVRQAQKMEALGTLAGGITHDFNNILGAVVLNTELALLDLEPDHPARQSLPGVLEAANRGKDLVKQIITFSRQREWDKKPFDLTPVVRETTDFLRKTLPKDVKVHTIIAPDCGAVLGDPSQIQQIVVNLGQNAALAMKDCGGDLEIILEPMDVDTDMSARHPDLIPGRYVRLSVTDTGCGMSPEIMKRIFEPFFTTRGPGGGTGLGLAVVHGIIKSYRGAITVYSEPGKGSVFNAFLPRVDGARPPAHPERTPEPVRVTARVLLVEDEKAQRESLTLSLRRLGYKVTARASGPSALAAFLKDPAAFDVVITDQTMPQMSGLELAEGLIKAREDIPIILCTGFSERVNGSTVGHGGIRDFIMKPFTLQEITRLIAKSIPSSGETRP